MMQAFFQSNYDLSSDVNDFIKIRLVPHCAFQGSYFLESIAECCQNLLGDQPKPGYQMQSCTNILNVLSFGSCSAANQKGIHFMTHFASKRNCVLGNKASRVNQVLVQFCNPS